MQEKKQIFSPIKQRILQFVDYLNVSKREFYARTGISRGTLDNATGITEETIAKLIAAYGEINNHWLLTGEGPMLKQAAGGEKAGVEEGPPGRCPFCQEKEKLIAAQQRTIDILERELLRCQAELDHLHEKARHPHDDGQKRKAG